MPAAITPPNPGKVAVALYDILCRAAEVDGSPIARAAKEEYREVIDQITAQLEEESAER